MAERTAWALCSEHRWWSVFGKPARGEGGRPGPPVHDDLVLRQFRAGGPNELRLADISEHPTAEGKLYICAVKDVVSNCIVGSFLRDRMTSELAVNAVTSAVTRLGTVSGCLLHNERAAHFARGHSSTACTVTAGSERWAGSGQPVTPRPWNRSWPCCRRTSSTAAAGTPERTRSSPGSNAPITAAGGRPGSVGCPPIEFEAIMAPAVALVA